MAYTWITITAELADATTNANLESIITAVQADMAHDTSRFGTVQLAAVNNWLNQYNNSENFKVNFYRVGTGVSYFTFFAGIFPAVSAPPSTNYKVYNGIMSQVGSAAPTVTIFDNTIGDIVWTRSSAGRYKGTLAGSFTAKTLILTGEDIANNGLMVAFERASSGNEINVQSDYPSVSGSNVVINPSDDLLVKFPFEIRVYA